MHFLFCRTNQQNNVLEKGMKDSTFEVYVLTEEFSAWFWLIKSLKTICAKPYPCLTSSKSLKWTSRVNFDLPKVGRMTINFELLNVSKMTGLKIYISQVMEILETSDLDIR